MTNLIGALGENLSITQGTHTVYTVPSGKASKGKIMYLGVAANTSTLVLTVNGIAVASPAAAAGADHMFSSKAAMSENTSTTAPTAVDDATTVAPCPQEYFLSAGDTVTMTIGVADFASMNCQFVGTEIDVT